MIKINKYLYIHFTTVLLLIVCYINRKLDILAINYAVIFMHELAHTVAAILIGLKPSHITFFPFGVNLKLKSSIVYSLCDEIILYISGPLLNIILALICIPFFKYNFFHTLYRCNVVLFIFNMLPIMPMDGAVILKKVFTKIAGSRKACFFMKIISMFFVVVLILAEIWLLTHSGFDFAVFFMIIFLTANIFTNKEKYHMDFVKELMFYNKKNSYEIKKAKLFVTKGRINPRKIAENFRQGNYYIIFDQTPDGKINRIYSECEIINQLIENNQKS